MMLQIRVHDLLGDRPGAPSSIANTPKMPPSVALLQRGILLQKLAGTTAFDAPHDLTDCVLGRIRQMQMHVIATDHTLDDAYVEGITDLPNQVPATQLDLASQYAVSVLRAKDQMHLQLVDAMGALSLLHAENLLKVSCSST